MKVLFLDVDGVLNGHEKHPDSPYTTIRPDCVRRLNRVVKATECRIVISSAWRYMMFRPRKNKPAAMTLLGFQYLFHTHGLMQFHHKRMQPVFIGHTVSDEEVPHRAGQVLRWVRENKKLITTWAAVDDMDYREPLGREGHRLVVTNGAKGLSEQNAAALVRLLNRTQM